MAVVGQNFQTWVSQQAAAAQASARSLLDLTVGSILRAVFESNAGVALWLQGLVLQVLGLTRAASSNGTDLDSWMADFGLLRLPAVAATGQVTFSRLTPTGSQQAVIPIGQPIQTADGTQNFTVTLDTTNGAYNAGLNGYVLVAGGSSVNVPVIASVAGIAGNALANTITTITQPIPGVDLVTNAAAFTNGLNAETDPAFRARFVVFLGSLFKSTKAAIGYAVQSVQQGLQYQIVENADYNGTVDYGFFYVVVDDGTGFPSTPLLNAVGSAIDAARALTTRFAVFAPSVVTVSVSLTITTASGYNHATLVGQVATAVQNYINALPLATSLPYSRIAQIAYDASPGVTNVSSVLVNGGTADITATVQQALVAGTMTVS